MHGMNFNFVLIIIGVSLCLFLCDEAYGSDLKHPYAELPEGSIIEEYGIETQKECVQESQPCYPYFFKPWQKECSAKRLYRLRSTSAALKELKLRLSAFVGQENVKAEVGNAVSAWIDTLNRHEVPATPVRLHFAGSWGVGKTTLGAAVGKAVFEFSDPTGKMGAGCFPIDISGYEGYNEATDPVKLRKAKEDIELQFSKRLEHCKHAVFLVDEVGVFPMVLVDVLINILKGGSVRGQPSSNAMVILTSDLGNDFSHVELPTWEDYNKGIQDYVRKIYEGTQLSDVIRYLYFFPLTRSEIKDVARVNIKQFLCKFPTVEAIAYHPDFINKVVPDDVEEGIDARNVATSVNSNVRGAVVKRLADDVEHCSGVSRIGGRVVILKWSTGEGQSARSRVVGPTAEVYHPTCVCGPWQVNGCKPRDDEL